MITNMRIILSVLILFLLAPSLEATGWSGRWTWEQNYDVDGLPVWWEATYSRIGIWVDVVIELECDPTYFNRKCCTTTGSVFFIEDNIVDVWNPGLTVEYNGHAEWQNDTLSSGGYIPLTVNGTMNISE